MLGKPEAERAGYRSAMPNAGCRWRESEIGNVSGTGSGTGTWTGSGRLSGPAAGTEAWSTCWSWRSVWPLPSAWGRSRCRRGSRCGSGNGCGIWQDYGSAWASGTGSVRETESASGTSSRTWSDSLTCGRESFTVTRKASCGGNHQSGPDWLQQDLYEPSWSFCLWLNRPRVLTLGEHSRSSCSWATMASAPKTGNLVHPLSLSKDRSFHP